MGMLPLKRLRTRLSIPLGLRHDSGTHLKRSDWWRKKRLVPVQFTVSPQFSGYPRVYQFSSDLCSEMC